jgi:hypothetical protein
VCTHDIQRSEVLTEITVVFKDVMQCYLVCGNRHSEGTYRLHLQDAGLQDYMVLQLR